MSQSRSLSKLAAAGFLVGASCFVQGRDASIFQKPHPNEVVEIRPNGVVSSLYPWKRPPHTEIRGGQTVVNTQQLSNEISTVPQSDVTRQMAASYSLLWSPGFLPKMGVSAVIFAALHVSGVAGWTGVFLSRHWHVYMSSNLQGLFAAGLPNVVLPLLSSSCCLLQLVINALVGAGGCAGFNTFLGPLRPLFLSFLVYLNLVARPPLGKGLLRVSLSLLPEIVDIWNQRLTNSMKQNSQAIASVALIQAVFEVEIPTMGCVACINKIDNSLRSSAPGNIVDATSWLDPDKSKGGRARVRCAVDTQDELHEVRKSIIASIEGAGFSNPVISRTVLEEKN
jgi:hypothetical protein